MAATLDFHVTVCDPREEFHGDWNSSQATLLTRMPDDAVLEIGTDERTAIVAVTHDPKLDDMALLEALKSPHSVGALGRAPTSKSAASAAAVRSGREPDRTPAWPGGPAHREQDAAEIAVAIAAELIWVRNTLGGAEAALPSQASARQG